MSAKSTHDGVEVWTLTTPDGAVRASIVPQFGALVASLVFRGRELLYQHPFFWEQQTERTRGGFPFLFPVCGRLERNGQAGAYAYDDQIYQMKIHGFSSRLPWTVRGNPTDAELVLTLTDTPATRDQYPFGFEVALRFKVMADLFRIEQEYRNRGAAPMPYYAGFHPYFLTPEPGHGKEQTKVDFRAMRRLLYNERLTDVVGRTDPPQFPADVSDPAINENLTVVEESNEMRLILPDGLTVQMKAEGVEDPKLFPYVQLYTMPDRPFFCIEPWMAFPNALNTVRGARWLAPGQAEHGVLSVWTTTRG